MRSAIRDVHQPDQPDDTRFMGLAMELAREAERLGEVPVGAVVVLDGTVIGRGFNRPIEANDPTAHAEINALREASKHRSNYRLTGAVVYVTLEPCAMCAGAMTLARIDRLVFGCSDPKAGAAGSLYDLPSDARLNHRIEVTSGICEAECSQLLKDFFERRRGSASS